ncbi:50S ribosomal protein L4 [Candidatus Peregrinibacteria bacterium]|jgi:large subunit ribosomal protein L4|nr:50S ribosomal protein L4 [Candidatus Peregrinibacteria bacterium]
MKIDLYNQEGKKVGSQDLHKTLFEANVNTALMHRLLLLQQSNARYSLSKVKTRSDVRGGGRKPFRQKGTGRARQGTIRAPHMKGGGVIFGPDGNQNFQLSMPKKQRRQALFSVLTTKAEAKEVFALEDYKGDISTKSFALMLKKLPVERSVLFLLAEKSPVFECSSRNLKNTKTILASYTNVADVLKYKKICLVGSAGKTLEQIFAK